MTATLENCNKRSDVKEILSIKVNSNRKSVPGTPMLKEKIIITLVLFTCN